MRKTCCAQSAPANSPTPIRRSILPAPLAVPPLGERSAELDRIIAEYAGDAIAELAAPHGAFTADDHAWVRDHAAGALAEIEAAVALAGAMLAVRALGRGARAGTSPRRCSASAAGGSGGRRPRPRCRAGPRRRLRSGDLDPAGRGGHQLGGGGGGQRGLVSGGRELDVAGDLGPPGAVERLADRGGGVAAAGFESSARSSACCSGSAAIAAAATSKERGTGVLRLRVGDRGGSAGAGDNLDAERAGRTSASAAVELEPDRRHRLGGDAAAALARGGPVDWLAGRRVPHPRGLRAIMRSCSVRSRRYPSRAAPEVEMGRGPAATVGAAGRVSPGSCCRLVGA